MHDTSDASSFRHQGTHPPADQRSPSATVPALGSASADAATAALIAPARTAIRLIVNGVRHRIDVEDRWTLVELLRDEKRMEDARLVLETGLKMNPSSRRLGKLADEFESKAN